jgi:monoamine oxidase
MVEIERGPPLRASAVIVTIPVGVLRTGRVIFEPPLPPRVQQALQGLDAGPVAKVFFRFDQAFWAPHWAFWLAGPQPPTFGLWVDVSDLAGRPTLCAFAVGEDARWAEAATEDERCRRADELLAAAGVVPGAYGSAE